MRLPGAYLHSTRRRTGVLGAGIAAAAAAFAVLGMSAGAATVQVRGGAPAASPGRAYDLVVRPAGPAAQEAAGTQPARPGDLAKLSGGITLAQYGVIRRLAGVQVAAPMTMVGYVPLTVTLSVPVPVLPAGPRRLALTAVYRGDNGLSTITQQDIASAYAGAGPAPATVAVSVRWTFVLPLVAVDPAAEAALLHLDRAVRRGSYLPAAAAAPGAPVPVLMASSIADTDTEQLILASLAAGASRPGRAAPQAARPGDAAPATATPTTGTPTTGTVAAGGTATVTATRAYQQLLSSLRQPGTAPVPGYWTTRPGAVLESARGDVVPRPVANDLGAGWGGGHSPAGLAAALDAEDTGFSSLTAHVARAGDAGQPQAGAALTAVGVFDPGMLPTSPVTPSPYRGEQLPGADPASRRLLHGQPLGSASDPAGYPNPAAALVMPLRDISALTAAAAYTGTDARAPIGSIRVRVAQASGDDALSRERVLAVADEIVRATGLDVDVTLAATTRVRTVALAAGRLGRPPLLLRETWYRSDTATVVGTSIDLRRMVLGALILVVGAAFFGNAAGGALRARRPDLATLTALGWRRRELRRQLLREFAAVALGSGAAAVLAAAATGAALGRGPSPGWAALGLPAAAAMTVGAAWLPVRQATAAAEPGRPPRSRRAAARRRLTAPGSLRQDPGRTLAGVLVIAAACAALGEELALRWAFGGVLVGSFLGRPVCWQAGAVDVAAVLAILALATITVADLDWQAAAGRAAELRTLHAIGWPAWGAVRLVAGEAALLGLLGGVTAAALDAVGCLVVVHRVPGYVLAATAVAAAAGMLLSLVAAGLSAALGCRARALRADPESRL